MSFYDTCMRSSSRIMFWGALAIFLLGFLSSLLAQIGNVNPYAVDEGATQTIQNVVSAFYLGLSSAVMPFFGSALLWLIDYKFPDRTGEKAE